MLSWRRTVWIWPCLSLIADERFPNPVETLERKIPRGHIDSRNWRQYAEQVAGCRPGLHLATEQSTTEARQSEVSMSAAFMHVGVHAAECISHLQLAGEKEGIPWR